MPHRSTSWAVVNPPTAANVAWHSEIWPAIPVITVIERKITAKTIALRHDQQPEVVRTRTAPARCPNATTHDAERVGARSSARGPRWPRRARRAAGRRPTSGSPDSRCWRSPGQKSSSRNSAHERQRRPQPVGEDAVRSAGTSGDRIALQDPEQEAAEQRHRDARELAEGRRRDRGHQQDREVRRRQLREQRSDQHAGEPGEEAREHPRRTCSPGRRSRPRARSSAGSRPPPACAGRSSSTGRAASARPRRPRWR